MSDRKGIALQHPDGDALRQEYVDGWVMDRLDRIRTYWNLGDAERVKEHVAILSDAVRQERIPEGAFEDYNG